MDRGQGKTDALQFVNNIMVSQNENYVTIQKPLISIFEFTLNSSTTNLSYRAWPPGKVHPWIHTADSLWALNKHIV
jgi:hypothetical protein